MYNDSNSLGVKTKEGRGSEGRHAGTGEGISARIHHVTYTHRGDGRKPELYKSLVQKIAVGVRNDQMFKVTAFNFKS